jgi:hypothetical protein
MQVPHPENETVFFSTYPFNRKNGQNDAMFYRDPRMTAHLDGKAIDQITAL